MVIFDSYVNAYQRVTIQLAGYLKKNDPYRRLKLNETGFCQDKQAFLPATRRRKHVHFEKTKVGLCIDTNWLKEGFWY